VTVLPTSSAPLTTTALASDATATTATNKKQKTNPSATNTTTPLSPPTTTLATTSPFSSTLPLLQRTLAERLAELEKRAGTYAGDVRVKAAAGSGSGAEVVVPKVGSLQTLLTQALHTNDDALFEYCLSASMSAASAGNSGGVLSQSSTANVPATLKQTIQRVPAAYLLPLLTRLTSLLHSRPSRALPVLTWLYCLLLTHPSYFLSLPPASLHAAFARLMGLVDARVASYKKMCRLQGKLDVIIAQLDAAGGGGGAVGDADLEAVGGPTMLYIEGRGMVRGEEAERGAVEDEAEAEDEEKGDRRQQPSSGKKRRRRRGHAAVSPVVRPQSADMDEDDMDEEEGAGRTKQRGSGGFALNGLNGADEDELELEDEEDD